MSTKYSGANLVLQYRGTNISGESRALEVTESVPEIDVTTYGDTDNAYIQGKKDRSFSVTILDTAASTITEELVEAGTSGTLEWAPEGTLTGKRKRTAGTALINRARKTFPHDDAVQFSLEGRISGSITKGTYA